MEENDKTKIRQYNSLVFPQYLQIGTTNACNAACIMCPRPKSGIVMTDELFAKIVTELEDYANMIEMVTLYWLGEPLLDAKLVERIKALRKIGIKHIQLSTNAASLDEEKIYQLLGAGLNDLRFSIDAIHKNTYEKIRCGLDFEKVMNNIHTAINVRNKEFEDVSFRFRLTEQDENKSEIEEWVQYWKKYAGSKDKIQIMPLISNINFVHQECVESAGRLSPCSSVFSTIVIDADGEVPLCCMDVEKRVVLGNIRETSIISIYQSLVLKNIRQKHLEGKRDEIAICKCCNGWEREFKNA